MYDGVAKFYDRYTADIDYGRLADFAEGCFRRFGNKGIADVSSSGGKPIKEQGHGTKSFGMADENAVNGRDVFNSTLVLDCACGTGALTCMLAERGYDMTGLDISQEMLYTAMLSAQDKELDILWLCQDMRRMDMYGSFAAILCMTDVINHITSEKQLDSFLRRVYNFTDEGGLLIFDFLNGNYFRNRVGNNVFFEDNDDGSCLWTSRYAAKSGICTYDIVIYERAASGAGELFTRTDESVREKSWEAETVTAMLRKNGFEICGLYDNMSFRRYRGNSERIYVAARKPVRSLKT